MENQGICSVITGSGRYVPNKVVSNEDFLNRTFFDNQGKKLQKENKDIVATLEKITEIQERRYIDADMVTSDMGYIAANSAISDAGLDPETLDYIVVAHNFGDIKEDNRRIDTCPTLAARIKHKLGIKNPYTVAYDLPFGCPGWVQAMIQADYFIKSGDAKKVLVIGAETLSRISDPHDIDSMLFSDGAGAVILEARISTTKVGMIKHLTRSDTYDHAHLLKMTTSNNPCFGDDTLFLKMNGRKLYEYAIKTVPSTLKECIEKANLGLSDIKKVFIHQANAKMDYNILERLFELYGQTNPDPDIMPMSISHLGNNSVATVPILYDLVVKERVKNQKVNKGDYLLFASVGAGMNINAFVYRVP
ncbi:3-oxoacyl-ACP synthase III family protein [Pleomorphovibrio marinus]|uniref:3-oxoacyl-ACP synthase III family protein n=1 Tax=Pleomorphovibrio marinus TaxID=2164132 RepID=UPI000E0AE4EA|nr:ketoacyl-ACP synthase III [Pleomorphovibrio marinus]